MALIFIQKPDGTTNKYRIPAMEGSPVTIGRNPEHPISLPDIVGVSGLHCSISYQNGFFYIKDEGSSNGTLREGVTISNEGIRPNCQYKIGEAILTFDPQGAAIAPLQAAGTPLQAAGAPNTAAGAPNTAANKPANTGGKLTRSDSKTRDGRKLNRAKSVTLNNSGNDGVSTLYIIAVLILAFIAGLTVRHWKATGKFILNNEPASQAPAVMPASPPAAKIGDEAPAAQSTQQPSDDTATVEPSSTPADEARAEAVEDNSTEAVEDSSIEAEDDGF